MDDVVFSVPEDAAPDMRLGRLVADDYNEEPLTYTIEAGNEEQFFGLDAKTGDLSLARTGLDFESIHTYSLTVRVTDGVDDALASIRIDIRDVNEPPVANAGKDLISQEGRTFTLDASASADEDQGDVLSYQWSAPSGVTLSDATSVGPAVTLGTDLVTKAESATLVFSLIVKDRKGLVSKADTVEVLVQKVNNGDTTGVVAIHRDNTLLTLEVSALMDPDGTGTSADSTTYQWQRREDTDSPWTNIPGAANTQFTIPDGTGRQVQFQAMVLHTDVQGYLSTLKSANHITLGNLPPRFPQERYAFAVPENSAVQTLLGSVTASDFNLDELTYRIATGNDQDTFHLEASTGILSVHRSHLDHESQNAYQLTVEVSDNTATASVPLTVTVTDLNEPPRALAGLPQAVQEGKTVTLDGSASFDVDAGDTLAWYWIAPKEIVLQQADTPQPRFTVPANLVLTDETLDLLFTLRTADAQGLVDTDTVTVTVHKIDNGDVAGSAFIHRDNTQLTLEVSALTDPDGVGSTIYQWQRREDADSPWTDVPEASGTQFAIPEGTGRLVQFQAVVRHTDVQGYPSTLVSANHITLGNLPPRFPQDGYTIAIPENSPLHAPVIMAGAADFNRDALQYRIARGNFGQAFGVDPDTGALAVAQNVLNHEARYRYRLILEVSDGLAVHAVPIMIYLMDINESPTAHAGEAQTVPEGVKVTLDARNSTDPDHNEVLTWRWTAPSGITLHQADTATPSFDTALDLVQDQEILALDFTLEATDVAGLAATDTVTVFVQRTNNGPATGTLHIVREQLLLTPRLEDLDDPDGLGTESDSTAYQWQHRNNADSAWTDIPDAHGVPYLIPAGTGRHVQFQVVATHTDQQGYRSSLTSTNPITMGNVPPHFRQAQYAFAVPENSPALTSVGMVSATDFNHDTLHYAIADGNSDQAFDINPKTGELSVNREVLDHEGLDRYQLAVEVTDDAASTSASVTVDITDINEAPVAVAGPAQSVQEGDTVNLDGSASSDVDEGDTLTWHWIAPEEIVLHQADSARPRFTVPANLIQTGETLDLSFTLETSDAQGLTASDTVIITVHKVDNGHVTGTATLHRVGTLLELDISGLADPDGTSPSADSTTYQWQRREDADSAWTDIPDASSHQYFIPVGTARPVQFQAIVTHTDQQGYRSGFATDRHVTMGNLPPLFQVDSYSFSLPENSLFQTPAGTVAADDFNRDTLHYAITSGNMDQIWRIDSDTGVVSVNRALLNHEERAEYQLTVEVSDNTAVDSVPITIAVTDVNEPPSAVAGIPQSVQEGDTVTLDGTGSSDVDTGDTLSWHWIAPEGITLQGTDTPQPAFTVPANLITDGESRELALTLETSDAQGLTDSDTVLVTVHKVNNGNTTGEVTIHRAGMELTLEVSPLADPDGIGMALDSTAYRWRCRHAEGADWTEIHGATGTRFTIPVGTASPVQFQALVLHTDAQGYPSAIMSANTITTGNVPPSFQQDHYAFTVPENSAPRTSVGSVSATDFNLDELTYRIVAGNDQDLFHLEASTGALSVHHPRLDHESRDTYELTVEVTDNTVAITVPLTVTVTDLNEAPRAVAGLSQSVQEGDSITLDGSASFDVDAEDTLSWHWIAPVGITLRQADTPQPSFTVTDNLVSTGDTLDLAFVLEATDAQGLMDSDTVTVTVHKIDNGKVAGSAIIHRDTTQLTLEVSPLTDPDGVGTAADSTFYQWQRRPDADSPWTNIPDASGNQFTIPAGTGRPVQFQAVVLHTDAQGFPSALVSANHITMGNVPPRFLQDSYTLAIPENSPPHTPAIAVEAADFNRDPLQYRIARGNFGQAFAMDRDTGALTVARDVLNHEARYQYRLTVEVSDGLAVHAVPVMVYIPDVNEAPMAHAGEDQTVPEGVTVTLDARDSADPDRDEVLTWHWTGPDSITLHQADTDTPTFDTAVDLAQDREDIALDFALVVTDTAGLATTDTVTVTVQRTDNGPATGSLRIDRERILLTLQLEELDDPDGLGTEPDSTSYRWQLKSNASRDWRNIFRATHTQFEIPMVVEPGSLYRAVATHRDAQGFVSRLYSNVIDLEASIAAATSTDTSLHAAPAPSECVIPVFELGALRVTDNLYIVTSPGTPSGHNIPNLELALDMREARVAINFKDFFLATGGLSRWGYPTSEVVVLEHNVLTQYYERGVVSFRFVGKTEWLQRHLLWDYLGAGLWDLEDQDSEPHILNPHTGEVLGPWSHKVSNYAVDGTWTGFADFFARHGGARSFGYPRTDARPDSDDPTMVSGARVGLPSRPGVIRQYFQAAILEYDPATQTIHIPALGNAVRDLLIPHHASLHPFVHAPNLHISQAYFPLLVLSCTDQE